jgi:hypothetical protein
MKIKKFADSDIPSFCWDRPWSFGVIKEKLRLADEQEQIRLISWILREGAMEEIWNLLKPDEIYLQLDKIAPLLGRRKEYWRYTFNVWHQLGKI